MKTTYGVFLFFSVVAIPPISDLKFFFAYFQDCDAEARRSMAKLFFLKWRKRGKEEKEVRGIGKGFWTNKCSHAHNGWSLGGSNWICTATLGAGRATTAGFKFFSKQWIYVNCISSHTCAIQCKHSWPIIFHHTISKHNLFLIIEFIH